MRKPDEALDLRGVPCPQNSARVLMKLAGMSDGTELALIIDDGEPILNVPLSLENEGYKVIQRKKDGTVWHLLIRKE